MGPDERLRLFNDLKALPPSEFEQLCFALKPPAGIVPSSTSPQGERVAALLNWAEGSTGRGLVDIQNLLDKLKGEESTIQGQTVVWLKASLINHRSEIIESRKEQILIPFPVTASLRLMKEVFISTRRMPSKGGRYEVQLGRLGESPFFQKEGQNIPITGNKGWDWWIQSTPVPTFECDVWCHIQVDSTNILSYEFHIRPPGRHAPKARSDGYKLL